MADNTTLFAGSGGDAIRSKDRSGTKTQIVLLDVGGTAGAEAIAGDTGNYLPTKLVDPAATTGTISAADVATTSANNSLGVAEITGAPTANSSVTATLSGHATCVVQLSGTANQTIAFERSTDGGTTYTPFAMEQVGVGSAVSSIAISDNKQYQFRGGVAGMTNLRVRSTARTSGSVSVNIQPSFADGNAPVNQGVPNSISNAWPVKVIDTTGAYVMPTGDASARTIHTTIDNANVPANVAQLAGTTTDTNSGNKSAGTLRVVLATDQPQLTNKLLVTPDANSAINLAQVGGSSTATGHGTASGAIRVELPTDGTGLVSAAQSGTWTVQPGNTANTTAWLANPTDPAATTGSISAADSGSTTGSSNSISQPAITGTPTANSFVSCAITGHNACIIQLSGTCNVALKFEYSDDGGTTWWAWSVEERDSVYVNSITISDNLPYTLTGHPRGATNVRVRCTTRTSGTCNVRLQPQFGMTQHAVRQGAGSSANPWYVAGDVASASADSGNPVKQGGKVSTSLSGITVAADGNRMNFLCSEDGAQYIRHIPAHPADYFDASPTTITSSTADTSIQAAGGANVRNYMTAVIIRNSSATNTGVVIKDGSGGTSKAHLPVPANGGVVFRFDPPLRSTANTAFFAACQDSVASVYVTPLGFKSKV